MSLLSQCCHILLHLTIITCVNGATSSTHAFVLPKEQVTSLFEQASLTVCVELCEHNCTDFSF